MERFKGVRYPITKNPLGFMSSTSDVDQIKSDMLCIVLTLPGERLFEPIFGTPFHMINFNQPDELIESQTRKMIALALKKWEKRVQVTEVKTKLKREFGSRVLRITIEFIDPINIDKTEKLSFECPFDFETLV